MRIISPKKLRDLWEQPGRGDAEQPLRAWLKEVQAATWHTPADIKRRYPSVSFLKGNRVCFNIGGKKYRLIAIVLYQRKTLLIRFVNTHEEYDKIDANTV